MLSRIKKLRAILFSVNEEMIIPKSKDNMSISMQVESHRMTWKQLAEDAVKIGFIASKCHACTFTGGSSERHYHDCSVRRRKIPLMRDVEVV